MGTISTKAENIMACCWLFTMVETRSPRPSVLRM